LLEGGEAAVFSFFFQYRRERAVFDLLIVIIPLSPFGLARANGAINPSRYKGRFLRKKGAFAIFSRESRKNAMAGALESGKRATGGHIGDANGMVGT